MSRPVITLLTDYGVGSQHVGALHAVLARQCPSADRIDFAHDIPAGDARWGAILLRCLAPEIPGAVHLAVVDPDVGTGRRAVAIELGDGGYAVGPDNGLLGLLKPVASAAAQLTAEPGRCATFDGRDLFAPTAARLARGEVLTDIGTVVPVNSIEEPVVPAAAVRTARLHAAVMGRDRFGNLALAAGEHDVAASGLAIGNTIRVAGRDAKLGRTFADVSPGGVLVYIDSNAMLSIAVRDGDAAAEFGIAVGDTVIIERGGARVA